MSKQKNGKTNKVKIISIAVEALPEDRSNKLWGVGTMVSFTNFIPYVKIALVSIPWFGEKEKHILKMR